MEHREPAELLEPTERDEKGRGENHEINIIDKYIHLDIYWLSSGERASPEVVRGRVPRWLQVGGVLLLGGEPTVKRTVRGLAEPP